MAPTKSDPKDFIPLTPRTFHILLALKDGPIHGYAIMKQVTEQSSGQVKIGPGTMYEAISRLVESQLIVEVPAPAEDEAKDKRKRRFYKNTPLGHTVMRLEAERLAELVGFVRSAEVLPG